MAWAKTVPLGARYDLTASGVADTLADGASAIAVESWTDDLAVADLCRRDTATSACDAFIAALAQRYDIDPATVTPTIAASTAITHVLMALVRAGDHVVVERPTYEALRRAPEILGARVSRLERKFEEGWAVVPERLAQLLTPRTRAVVLSNLHNPSGVGIDAKTMLTICELASRVGAMVLVDEVYLDYCFSIDPGAAQLPACRVAKNGVSWSSTTKCMGFSALRAGWIVAADPDVAKAIRAASDYLHVYPTVATTRLATRVLAEADALAKRAHAISTAGRRVVERWLAAEQRVSWVAPTAGLTGLVKLPAFMQDTVLCDHLRQRYETQVVPGSMFEAPGFVRLSFGIAPDQLEQALANFTAALDDLV
jgi:aspartate/methionine/tyrosine aminotransferase